MDTWYHLMVSTLLFTKPTVKLFHLSNASQDAIVRMQDQQVITALDHVLLAAMEADIYQVSTRQCLWCHSLLMDPVMAESCNMGFKFTGQLLCGCCY